MSPLQLTAVGAEHPEMCALSPNTKKNFIEWMESIGSNKFSAKRGICSIVCVRVCIELILTFRRSHTNDAFSQLCIRLLTPVIVPTCTATAPLILQWKCWCCCYRQMGKIRRILAFLWGGRNNNNGTTKSNEANQRTSQNVSNLRSIFSNSVCIRCDVLILSLSSILGAVSPFAIEWVNRERLNNNEANREEKTNNISILPTNCMRRMLTLDIVQLECSLILEIVAFIHVTQRPSEAFPPHIC